VFVGFIVWNEFRLILRFFFLKCVGSLACVKVLNVKDEMELI